MLCGLGPPGVGRDTTSSDQSAALDRVQKETERVGIMEVCRGIMYIMQEVFGMLDSRLIVPLNEKYGKFVQNEVLEAGNFGKYDAQNRFEKLQHLHNLQRVSGYEIREVFSC